MLQPCICFQSWKRSGFMAQHAACFPSSVDLTYAIEGQEYLHKFGISFRLLAYISNTNKGGNEEPRPGENKGAEWFCESGAQDIIDIVQIRWITDKEKDKCNELHYKGNCVLLWGQNSSSVTKTVTGGVNGGRGHQEFSEKIEISWLTKLPPPSDVSSNWVPSTWHSGKLRLLTINVTAPYNVLAGDTLIGTRLNETIHAQEWDWLLKIAPHSSYTVKGTVRRRQGSVGRKEDAIFFSEHNYFNLHTTHKVNSYKH